MARKEKMLLTPDYMRKQLEAANAQLRLVEVDIACHVLLRDGLLQWLILRGHLPAPASEPGEGQP